MSSVRFENLTLGYERHPAVHHLSGKIPAGAMLAVMGPNGAGKSTLLKGIAGIVAPMSGRIDLDGFRREDVAYMPQQPNIDRSFPISVRDFVAMGLWRKAGMLRRIGRGGRASVTRAIAAVGLTGFETRNIGTLSGGQMQRMLFARVIVQDAPLILLDEPFAAVDLRTMNDLLAVLREWNRTGRTVVAVLHDVELVRAHFPETLLLARHPVAWGPTEEVLRRDGPFLRAQDMMEAWDEHAAVCDQDAAA